MKKYLMTGIAALAMGGMFTSCSHDMSLYNGDGTKAVVDKYEEAFVSAYGEPAANQTWGFGSTTAAATRGMTRSVGTYADYKGSLTPEESYQDQNDNWQWKTRPYTFPSAPTSYPTDKPENASYYGGGYQSYNGGNFWMDENVSNRVEVQGYCNLYIVKSGSGEGNVDIAPDNYWYVGNVSYQQKIRVYICPGVNLTILPTFANNLQANVEYYVCPGANLICDANFKLNGTALYVAPGATATFKSIETNNTGIIYNQGTITTEGKIYIANNVSVLVNDGSITAGSADAPTELEIAGSGNVQNNAEINIYGNTFVSSNSAIWVNNGHWTTQNYHYTAGSNNVINNCFLKVTNEFNINMSSASAENGFKIDSNGGVETKTFNGGKAGDDPNSKSGPYKVIMGHKSLFKVTGTATLEGGNKGWGFFGPADGEYAVFQAKNVVRAAGLEKTQGAVTYGGNLYVSAETHFAQGHDGQDSDGHYFISEEGGFSVNTNIYAAGFKAGKPNITIQKTPCNPGFGGSDPFEPVIRVIAEDMGDQTTNESSDFDFNDVVFDVTWVSESKVKIKILAAGGTLPLTVGWNGQNEDEYRNFEVHNLLGYSETMIINTRSSVGNHIDGVAPYEFEFNGSFSKDNFAANVRDNSPVKVRKNNRWYAINAEQGRAAGKVAVGPDYEPWCNERQDIDSRWKDDNGGLFLQYSQDPVTLTKYWYRKAQ